MPRQIWSNSQSLVYLFVTLQLSSSGLKLLAEFSCTFNKIHKTFNLRKSFYLRVKFRETAFQRWKRSPLSWQFLWVNGNLKFLIMKRVDCCLFKMICIKLVTSNFFSKGGCQNLFKQFGDGRSKQWKRNGEREFQIDWKTSLWGLSLPYLWNKWLGISWIKELLYDKYCIFFSYTLHLCF